MSSTSNCETELHHAKHKKSGSVSNNGETRKQSTNNKDTFPFPPTAGQKKKRRTYSKKDGVRNPSAKLSGELHSPLTTCQQKTWVTSYNIGELQDPYWKKFKLKGIV